MPRPKGSPNKTTKDVKELLTNILVNHAQDLDACIAGLPPHRKVDALLKLAALIVPRPAIEVTPAGAWMDDNAPIVISINDLHATPPHHPAQH